MTNTTQHKNDPRPRAAAILCSHQQASGAHRLAPCDVFAFTFHALDTLEHEGVSTDAASRVAAAAARAARAALIREFRAQAAPARCWKCKAPADLSLCVVGDPEPTCEGCYLEIQDANSAAIGW